MEASEELLKQAEELNKIAKQFTDTFKKTKVTMQHQINGLPDEGMKNDFNKILSIAGTGDMKAVEKLSNEIIEKYKIQQ